MSASITDDPFANGLAGNSASTRSLASAFNPVTGGAGSFTLGNITDPSSTGVDWAGLGKALQGLVSSGQQQGDQSQGGNLQAQAGQAQSGAFGPRNPNAIANLVQMLTARRDQYMNAANPQGAQPVVAARPSGLLGF
jgi:hypothetical protein